MSRHVCVADGLDLFQTVSFDHFVKLSEEVVEPRNDLLWSVLAGKRGKTNNIREDDDNLCMHVCNYIFTLQAVRNSIRQNAHQ